MTGQPERWDGDVVRALPAVPRRRRRCTAPLEPGLIGALIDVYLAAVAATVRDGQPVDLPHLGRLRLGSVGEVILDPLPGLVGGEVA